ncbi:uncharacterized protein BROUX77_007092 [Berkeleyomyces rouxiae]|uniref:uncharacterized protein n=1 Tax=Berkeleyomyces rouxiae TaxID=2035830 RepID=UPI003B7F1A23
MATTIAAVSIPPSCDKLADALPGPSPNPVSVAIPRSSLSSASRHLPYCPPGTAQSLSPDHLSLSPQDSEDSGDETETDSPRSLLFPPHNYERVSCGGVSVYSIDPLGLSNAVHYMASQPLPAPSRVFPWLHGLHPRNNIQRAFFARRRPQHHGIPECLRSVTLVKANGDLSKARLKGALAPSDIITRVPRRDGTPDCNTETYETGFIDADPKTGFSVRNFSIQSAKTATISDIIVYGDNRDVVFNIAHHIASAQSSWRAKQGASGRVHVPVMNTFVCVTPFAAFEEFHSELVSIDSAGHHTGRTVDFQSQEAIEMRQMTKPTQIAHNVWLGSTPNLSIQSPDDPQFDVFIECADNATVQPDVFRELCICLPFVGESSPIRSTAQFPASGSISSPSCSQLELGQVVDVCASIYKIAHGSQGSHEASQPSSEGAKVRPRKILLHCGDGYTETTLLAIAYYAYSTGRPIPTAWLDLHTELKRNFFAYPSDVALLKQLSLPLMQASPACKNVERELLQVTATNEPRWFRSIDGSFPSRITDYMYLGSISHAKNPDLLRKLGITQLLSVGEVADWNEGEFERWGSDNVCLVQGVQDNGIDGLTSQFERCFEFIDRARQQGSATLVHCRVGVSRSATICIAEIMRSFNLSLPRAYCFVRARRLNVIIQPHLRFMYELLRWEEVVRRQNATTDALAGPGDCGTGNGALERELEWAQITREIALLNQPYFCS